MRKCPHCRCDLALVTYEGRRILRCETCGGHLLSSSVRRGIEQTAGSTRPELAAEALARYRGRRTERIACPRCRRTMDRRSLGLPGVNADFDVCRDCDLLWLDGGELALDQLNHESTAAFADAQEMRGRAAELESDPVRRAKFQEALSRLPLLPPDTADFAVDSENTFLSDIAEDEVLEVLGRLFRLRMPG